MRSAKGILYQLSLNLGAQGMEGSSDLDLMSLSLILLARKERFLAFSDSKKEAKKVRSAAGALVKSERKERSQEGRVRTERLKSKSSSEAKKDEARELSCESRESARMGVMKGEEERDN